MRLRLGRRQSGRMTLMWPKSRRHGQYVNAAMTPSDSSIESPWTRKSATASHASVGRYPVDMILTLLCAGMSDAWILADYDGLEPADILAAVAFAVRRRRVKHVCAVVS